MSKNKLNTLRTALRLEWDALAQLGAKRLSAILGRTIETTSDRFDFYNWGFGVDDSPLTEEDMTLLFDTVGADDIERGCNDFGEFPVSEINQGLAEKIVKPYFPFLLRESLADEDGVWFFGPAYSFPFDLSAESAETFEDEAGATRCSKCSTMIVCADGGDMPGICPGCTRKLVYSAYSSFVKQSECKCNGKFYAHQVGHHDIITDGSGNYLEDRGVYQGNAPFGPFVCTDCGASYEELPIAEEQNILKES